jgi:hypothetical protein
MSGGMVSTRTMRIASFTLCAITLAGCTLGRGYSAQGWSVAYAGTGPDVRAVGPSRSVAIAVLDQRPYVLDGSKPDSFVGLSRNEFGIPYEVLTPKGAPMASDMAAALLAADAVAASFR